MGFILKLSLCLWGDKLCMISKLSVIPIHLNSPPIANPPPPHELQLSPAHLIRPDSPLEPPETAPHSQSVHQ